MSLSETQYLADRYSHIYVEKGALSYPLTARILSHFPTASVITINHYKDIFNRGHQDFTAQKYSQALILAVNHGQLLYPGARFCQSFGNTNFYYTSGIMNCIYDCEYCYLQGMYPSGNMVLFVNLEDYFAHIDTLLKQQSMYICISYDTDMLAIEGITGMVEQWVDFTAARDNLRIEIRTKSAYTHGFSVFKSCDRVIFAWTLSPEELIQECEHMAPSLDARLHAVELAIESGYTVRLCFDPMIYTPDYKNRYSKLYSHVFDVIDSEKVLDVSIGLFRISSEYIKSMRRKRTCRITAYPYTNTDGMCSYEPKKSGEMLDFARLELSRYIASSQIYDI